MQWDSSKNAGFTPGKPWLRINDNYKEINVEKEFLETDSLLNAYMKLIKLRKTENALSYGRYVNLNFLGGLLQFTRRYLENDIVVYISFDIQVEIMLPSQSYQVLYGKAEKNLNKNETLILKMRKNVSEAY